MDKDTTCRLCLQNRELLDDLFCSVSNKRPSLRLIFQKSLEISLRQFRDWPSKVCAECVTYINGFREYRNKVQENQKRIELIFGMAEESIGIDSSPIQQEEVEVEKTCISQPVQKDSDTEKVMGESEESQRQSLPHKRRKTPRVREVYRHNAQFVDTMNVMNLLKCNLCHDKKFRDMPELRSHYKEIHSEFGFIVCCNKKFIKSCDIYDHIQFHIDGSQFMCKDCGKYFGSKRYLRIHKQTIHADTDVPVLKCGKCGKGFKSKYVLKTHMLTHTEKGLPHFACDNCPEIFISRYKLKVHKYRLHGNTATGSGTTKIQEQFVCDECGVVFAFKDYLAQHRKNTHNPDRKKSPCEICGKFVFRMDSHRLWHSRIEESVSCDVCGNVLKSEHSLMIHKRTMHNKDAKMYSCLACSKAFRSKSKLSDHTAIHTGIKRFTCYFCPEQFAASTSRTHHCKIKHPLELEDWRKAKYKCRVENTISSELCI